jgi:succinyl-CoA synthetase beta subunit
MPVEIDSVDAPATEHEAKVLAAEWGLPVVEGKLAGTADEAAAFVERLGSAAAMKVSAPGLLHKTEVGGVRLGVTGADAARTVFGELMAVGRARDHDADGVLVERMASGFEVIVGLTLDPVFGPVVMIGPGGLGAEGMGLERVAPAPLDVDAAERLIRRVPGLHTALDRLHSDAAGALAETVSMASRKFTRTSLTGMEMNPLAWSDDSWKLLDVVMTSGPTEGDEDGATR